MGKRIILTPDNFMHHISHYGMAMFPEAGLHFVQILRFMCLTHTSQGYELCSSWVTPGEHAADGEGMNPLASQAFMSYKRNLLGGKVAIRDVYAIIARHLPPDDPTYLENMSEAELEEMASRDVGWAKRPPAFDSMSLEEAMSIISKAGTPAPMASKGDSNIKSPQVPSCT